MVSYCELPLIAAARTGRVGGRLFLVLCSEIGETLDVLISRSGMRAFDHATDETLPGSQAAMRAAIWEAVVRGT